MREVLERRFASIGARVVIGEPWRGEPRIDIRSDRRGEYFDIRFVGGQPSELDVVDVQPRDRHLVLLARTGAEKSKFLCGHDERHWFVAAVPDSARAVTGVASAKAALQPDPVRALVARTRPKDPHRRRNDAYVRQGEWFFVPAPDLRVAEWLVLRNEPLFRPGGTPHVLEFAHRRGGRSIYVDWMNGRQLSESRYQRLPPKERRSGRWSRQMVDPELYAKGAVRHPDHATIDLRGWHRVLMNTESRDGAGRLVLFVD